jgi:hypothetical protein
MSDEAMRTASFWVAIWLACNLAFVIFWDAWQLARGRPDLTISFVIEGWSAQSALVPLLVGLLVGHLFWK